MMDERTKRNLIGVHPKLIAVVSQACLDSRGAFGVAAKATRTAEEQYALFKQKVTQKDGYKNKSNHQCRSDGTGWAVDLTPIINGKYDVNNEEAQKVLATYMSIASRKLNIRITWGGNWYETMDTYGSSLIDIKAAVERYKVRHPGPDFIDLPHFELAV